ncbi:MAG: hypothetical protein CML02_10935 [Pseudooceanicola sp.]|nr:hypothetical protein [Pseudooceanicola sp.]
MQPADRARSAAQRIAASRLELRLSALAGPVATRADGRRALDPGGGLGAMVREVDETILPRRLEFDNGLGDRITVDVASGRLRAVVALDLSAPDPPGIGALSGHAFFDAADPLVQPLAEVLRHICREGSGLTVRAQLCDDAGEFDTIGVSLHRLARPSRPILSSIDLAAMADTLAPQAEALVLVGGGTVRRESGVADAVARLHRLATDELAERAGCEPPPQAMAWCGAQPGDGGILCLSAGSAMLFATMPYAQIMQALRHWQAGLAG